MTIKDGGNHPLFELSDEFGRVYVGENPTKAWNLYLDREKVNIKTTTIYIDQLFSISTFSFTVEPELVVLSFMVSPILLLSI